MHTQCKIKMAAYLEAAIASALKKAGKDENFRLKSEQRAIIEAVVCSKKGRVRCFTDGCQRVPCFPSVK